jgi:signal peptide peptidase-like protein 2B
MLLLTVTFAGDIVHPDSIAPKKPGCDNNFVLVQFYKYLGQKIN